MNMPFCYYCHEVAQIFLTSQTRVAGKQCRPRSDATEHGVKSWSTTFALDTGISLKQNNNNDNNNNNNSNQTTGYDFYRKRTYPKS